MKNVIKQIANSVFGKPQAKSDGDAVAEDFASGLRKGVSFDEWHKGGYTFGCTSPIPNRKVENPKQEKSNEPEEWIWVDGYKGTDKDMRCRNVQFEIGKCYVMPEDAEISVCSSGYHLCLDLKRVYGYYAIQDGNRFFKVRALVRKSDYETCLGLRKPAVTHSPSLHFAAYAYGRFDDDDKLASKSIEFIEECTIDEILAAGGWFDEVSDWTEEQKKEAISTAPWKVKTRILEEKRFNELISLGYSEILAKYVSKSEEMYDRAVAIASQPGVSMDVKIMATFGFRDEDDE